MAKILFSKPKNSKKKIIITTQLVLTYVKHIVTILQIGTPHYSGPRFKEKF